MKFLRNAKKAQSLAEALITLFIASVLIFSLSSIIMQSNTTARKSFRAIYDSMYEVMKEIVLTNCNSFDATGNCIDPNGVSNTFVNSMTFLDTNFCQIFLSKVNSITDPNAVGCTNTMSTALNFTTSNGVSWYGLSAPYAPTPDPAIPTGTTVFANAMPFKDITVDINGSNKGANKDDIDRFHIRLFRNGIPIPYGTSEETFYPASDLDAAGIITECTNNASSSACQLANTNHWNRTCNEIKNNWPYVVGYNGVYNITPLGGASAFPVYCGMTGPNAGGYTLLVGAKSGATYAIGTPVVPLKNTALTLAQAKAIASFGKTVRIDEFNTADYVESLDSDTYVIGQLALGNILNDGVVAPSTHWTGTKVGSMTVTSANGADVYPAIYRANGTANGMFMKAAASNTWDKSQGDTKHSLQVWVK